MRIIWHTSAVFFPIFMEMRVYRDGKGGREGEGENIKTRTSLFIIAHQPPPIRRTYTVDRKLVFNFPKRATIVPSPSPIQGGKIVDERLRPRLAPLYAIFSSNFRSFFLSLCSFVFCTHVTNQWKLDGVEYCANGQFRRFYTLELQYRYILVGFLERLPGTFRG